MSFSEKVKSVLDQVAEKFQEHPKDKGQTYLAHFWNSTYFGMCSFVCSVVFLLHAIFPFMFEKTGGNLIFHLEKQINNVRHHCTPNKLDVSDDSIEGIGGDDTASVDAVVDASPALADTAGELMDDSDEDAVETDSSPIDIVAPAAQAKEFPVTTTTSSLP